MTDIHEAHAHEATRPERLGPAIARTPEDALHMLHAIDRDTRETPLLDDSIETSLQALVTARGWVLAAKRTRSPRLVARAELDPQAAVDGARDLGVNWGQIGSTLGITRGNTDQYYRKRLSHNGFPVQRTVAGNERFVPPM